MQYHQSKKKISCSEGFLSTSWDFTAFGVSTDLLDAKYSRVTTIKYCILKKGGGSR